MPPEAEEAVESLTEDSGASGNEDAPESKDAKSGQRESRDAADEKSESDKPEPKAVAGAKKATIASDGGKELPEKSEEKAPKNPWPENWRELHAEHISAGDQKAYKRELKRLERIATPAGLYGMYRELEGKFTSGGLVKVPGKDAKPEDVAEFHKALGVPEKPEDYFKHVKLENGAVIGDADKPLIDGFAAAVHRSGATPEVVNAALNWHYAQQEEQAAAMDEADDDCRRQSERDLKEEFGNAFKRKTNAISGVFSMAPGGTDVSNEKSLYARLMGGRTADGKIIGNDPDMVRWLVSIAQEINPSATVVEDGNQSGLGVDAEIAAIEKRMRTDRRGYFKDEAAQNRYRELLDVRGKIQARR